MNKVPRLSPSGIEYLDYSWGLYSGCLNWKNGVCPVGDACWAKRFTRRFKSHYPNGFEPTFYPEAFLSPLHLKKPSRIGVGWMGDLFGDWVDPVVGSGEYGEDEHGCFTLKGRIFNTIERCPQHRFLFLTKCPWNLPEWSPFPDNCFVGVTVTDDSMVESVQKAFDDIVCKIKFISFEPLLGGLSKTSLKDIRDFVCQWVIIGAQTKPYKPPKVEWVEEIVRAADGAKIPVFLKENLYPLLGTGNGKSICHNNKVGTLRQEMPAGKET